METVAFVNRLNANPEDIDPINEVEAVIYCRGQAQNLAMNAYRVKLQNVLRITHRMVASVQFTSPERVLVQWTPQGGSRRSESFVLERIEGMVEKILSISHGEKTAVSMGLMFTPGKSTFDNRS